VLIGQTDLTSGLDVASGADLAEQQHRKESLVLAYFESAL